jgi:PHD/YefM family antitoxin component YafN of YafNO toxin-antitoxin module
LSSYEWIQRTWGGSFKKSKKPLKETPYRQFAALASAKPGVTFWAMSTVDVATLKARAEELIAKAIAGEPTVIEQNGKRAVLLPCEGLSPDCVEDPETDRLLSERSKAPGHEPAAADWEALR